MGLEGAWMSADLVTELRTLWDWAFGPDFVWFGVVWPWPECWLVDDSAVKSKVRGMEKNG